MNSRNPPPASTTPNSRNHRANHATDASTALIGIDALGACRISTACHERLHCPDLFHRLIPQLLRDQLSRCRSSRLDRTAQLDDDSPSQQGDMKWAAVIANLDHSFAELSPDRRSTAPTS